MDIRFYFGFLFSIIWTYFCIANVTQEHARVLFFDDRYISEAQAITIRRRRGDVYLTNCTVVLRVALGNNITIKIEANVKGVGTIVFLETKLCDGFKISWLKQVLSTNTNITDCPVLAGKYHINNLQIPPKNFPLPVPKGNGIVHLYLYLTQNMQTVFHGALTASST